MTKPNLNKLDSLLAKANRLLQGGEVNKPLGQPECRFNFPPYKEFFFSHYLTDKPENINDRSKPVRIEIYNEPQLIDKFRYNCAVLIFHDHKENQPCWGSSKCRRIDLDQAQGD